MEPKVSGLGHLKALALRVNSLVGQVAEAAANAIEELAGIKADKAVFITATLIPAGWKATPDSEVAKAGWPYAYDIPVAGATDKDGSEVIIQPASQPAAARCGVCSSNKTTSGVVRLYAAKAPDQAITAQVRLIKS